jgi:endonuclease/exonuclease/phosphatase family metal-dependent hydrolase
VGLTLSLVNVKQINIAYNPPKVIVVKRLLLHRHKKEAQIQRLTWESFTDGGGAMKLRVLSYNIHGCVDSQRKIDVEKIATIISNMNADIIALQEVDTETPICKNRSQAKAISDFIGFDYLYFPVEKRGRHAFGLAILCRYPIEQSNCFMLPNLYPRLKMRKRGVLRARIQTPLGCVHLINTHLSVYRLERFFQLIAVLGWSGLRDVAVREPIIFCGDLNANPSSLIYRRLSAYLNDVQKEPDPSRRPRPTFPSKIPVLRIDHILISDRFQTVHSEVTRNALTAKASDHLPLVADLRLKMTLSKSN